MGKYIDELCKIDVTPVVDAASMGKVESYQHYEDIHDDADIDYDFLREARKRITSIKEI